MPTIKYPKNPNIDTAFVEQDDGTKNRALMIAPQDISTLELPNNPNSTKGYITVDGKKQRVILTADITGGGGGGSSLPDQTGHSGEFLTTDGTDASWAAVNALQNTATGTDALTIIGTPTSTTRAINIGNNSSATSNAFNAVAIGASATVNNNGAVAIGPSSVASGEASVAINGQANMPNSGSRAVVIGGKVSGNKSIVIMTGNTNSYTNITASYATVLGYIANPNTIESNSFYVGVGISANQTVKLLSSDGTIPSDRLVHAINKYSTMPTAASTNEGWIVQFTGTTDSTYTHGHLYECVSDGGNPATYSWTEVSMGGGGLQNTATGNNSLTILGTATSGYSAVNVGYSSRAASSSCAYGYNSQTTGVNSAAIGNGARADAYSNALGNGSQATAQGAIAIAGGVATALCAYQLGTGTNSTPRSFAVGGWFNNAQHEYQLLSLDDGLIPAARHAALPAADGTYTLQLVISNGVPTLSWVAV